MTTIAMLAKECLPGKVKTRLHPPLSLSDAAAVAAACIDLTATTVESVPWTRKILCIDGRPPRHDFSDWDIIEQTSGGLDDRIAALLDYCHGPTVVIGMDTPHLDRDVLAELSAPWEPEVTGWFGPADDGGFWALGLREPCGDLVRGVPMSLDETGRFQLERLQSADISPVLLPSLRDIDTFADLSAAAEQLPGTELSSVASRYLTRLQESAS